MSLFMEEHQLFHRDGSPLSEDENIKKKDIELKIEQLGVRKIDDSLSFDIDKSAGVSLFSESVYHPIGMSDEEAIKLRDILCEFYGIPEPNIVKSVSPSRDK